MVATDTKPAEQPEKPLVHRLHIVLPRSLADAAFQRADAEKFPSISEYVRQLVRDDLKGAKREGK